MRVYKKNVEWYIMKKVPRHPYAGPFHLDKTMVWIWKYVQKVESRRKLWILDMQGKHFTLDVDVRGLNIRVERLDLVILSIRLKKYKNSPKSSNYNCQKKLPHEISIAIIVSFKILRVCIGMLENL